MFVSYTAGVILLSLAIYGLWHLAIDAWNLIRDFHNPPAPTSSMVIILKDMENDVEYLVRFLGLEMGFSRNKTGEQHLDIIIADAGSSDLTVPILTKLAEEHHFFTLVPLRNTNKFLIEILPFCRGSLIHICDLTGRLKKEEFQPAARFLLKK